MVLALDYMQKTKTVQPDVEEHALEKIEIGYRRLLGFEVKSEPGGFDWWGKPPANLFLSAYGLMEFRDMAEVYPVDPDLIRRIVAFLRSKQQADGSWQPPQGRKGWSTDMGKGQAFNLTAYIAWGLARAGEPSETALRWLAARSAEIEDPYGLALAALAFLTADPDAGVGHMLAARLTAAAKHEAEGVSWKPSGSTGVGARGHTATIETTALAIQALLLDGEHRAIAYRALERLIQWRGADGRFGTTQSTILALQALLAAEAGTKARGDLTVLLDRGLADSRSFDLPAGSTERCRATFAGRDASPIAVSVRGEGRVRTTASRTSWVPWNPLPTVQSRLAFTVRYPAEELPAGRRAEATVRVRNTTNDKAASVVTLEVGIPPGCTVLPREVQGKRERVELGERHLVIYLRELGPREERTFRVRFTPRYALDVVTAPSKAYEYYVPEEAILVPPQPVRAVR